MILFCDVIFDELTHYKGAEIINNNCYTTIEICYIIHTFSGIGTKIQFSKVHIVYRIKII